MDIVTKLKGAMRTLPSGVAVLTTHDPDHAQNTGMTVSSVISVTMDPPSMLVAVNRSSSFHGPLVRSGQFCIGLLDLEHRDQALIFATPARRDERFKVGEWASRHGLNHLANITCLFCRTTATMVSGSHELFIGEVFDVQLIDNPRPVGWLQGGFHTLEPMGPPVGPFESWAPDWIKD